MDDLDALQNMLDACPSPLEPLDVSALDGFLCGVLLQPVKIPSSQWLRYVTDGDGRALPSAFEAAPLHQIVMQRHGELDRAIAGRKWFDPWIFELDEETPPGMVVAPWVAGFALAVEEFPALLKLDVAALTEPLALLYRHLDPEDLEDADELLAAIDDLEPPQDLAEAVEDLVRATLLMADVSRPLAATSTRRPAHRKPGRGPRH